MLQYAVIEERFLATALVRLNQAAKDGWRLDQIVRVPMGDEQLWVLVIRRLWFEELEDVPAEGPGRRITKGGRPANPRETKEREKEDG